MGPTGGSALLGWLREQTPAMVELLERLARAESPSDDVAAQGESVEILEAELNSLGLQIERLPGETMGDSLLARRPAERNSGPRQLLLGHLDTVWPVGTLARMPVELRDGALFGPGVFDMKGGLVQMLFALRGLDAVGLVPACDPIILINADEELSSPESRKHILRIARGAARVYVMEPSAGPDGDLKTGRKGVGRFTVTVEGVASHAGLDPESGRSAILEVSHQIQSLFALNDPARGITVNVGTIDGGLRPNVIAPEVVAQVEARVVTAEDAIRVEEHIRGLTPVTDGVSLEVEGSSGDRRSSEPRATGSFGSRRGEPPPSSASGSARRSSGAPPTATSPAGSPRPSMGSVPLATVPTPITSTSSSGAWLSALRCSRCC